MGGRWQGVTAMDLFNECALCFNKWWKANRGETVKSEKEEKVVFQHRALRVPVCIFTCFLLCVKLVCQKRQRRDSEKRKCQ